jgi:hypothetical protein
MRFKNVSNSVKKISIIRYNISIMWYKFWNTLQHLHIQIHGYVKVQKEEAKREGSESGWLAKKNSI